MNNFTITLFLFTILYIGCINRNNRKKVFAEYLQDKYNTKLKSFPAFLVNFFPKQLADMSGMDETTDTTNNCIYFKYFDLSDHKASSIDSIFRSNAIATYSATDTNLISIRSKSLIYDDPSLEVFYDKIFINHKYFYPIPYFQENDFTKNGITKKIFSSVSPSGLTNDFTIHLLESKPGNYWKGLKPSEQMPEGWKNGFSKGVCVNTQEEVVIYWFVIW